MGRRRDVRGVAPRGKLPGPRAHARRRRRRVRLPGVPRTLLLVRPVRLSSRLLLRVRQLWRAAGGLGARPLGVAPGRVGPIDQRMGPAVSPMKTRTIAGLLAVVLLAASPVVAGPYPPYPPYPPPPPPPPPVRVIDPNPPPLSP